MIAATDGVGFGFELDNEGGADISEGRDPQFVTVVEGSGNVVGARGTADDEIVDDAVVDGLNCEVAGREATGCESEDPRVVDGAGVSTSK